MTSPFARRRCLALVTTICLSVAATACTVEDAAPPQPAPGESTSAEGSPAAEPAPEVPARVRVTRVSGRLKPRDRAVLADNIEKVVTRYFDDAFLGGDYPRSSFGDAFATFSDGAARTADDDRDLLTNRLLGPGTESIEVRRQTAYLSVLAPYKVAAGVTAKVQLRYVADLGSEPARLVNVKGRLLLSRKAAGGWKIFGYDLDRSTRRVGKGS